MISHILWHVSQSGEGSIIYEVEKPFTVLRMNQQVFRVELQALNRRQSIIRPVQTSSSLHTSKSVFLRGQPIQQALQRTAQTMKLSKTANNSTMRQKQDRIVIQQRVTKIVIEGCE